MLAALACLAGGCGVYRVASVDDATSLAWPQERPRIVFEGTIDLTRSPTTRGAKLFRWLADDVPLPTTVGRPYGVAWSGDDVLVTDADAGRVARIDVRGRMTSSEDGLFERPIGIAACLEGVVVTDAAAGRVALLDRDLQFSRWLAEGLIRPTGVTCVSARVFVAETGRHRIVVIEPGVPTTRRGERGSEGGQFNFPAALAADGGTLLVGDTLNFRVQRVEEATGRFVAAFGKLGDAPGETPRVKGIAVDRARHVWVSDAHTDRVSVYDERGTLLVSLGGSGARPARFSFPAGIAAHEDGRVVVADCLNRRLQVFRVIGAGEEVAS